jgi:hypothetical protein
LSGLHPGCSRWLRSVPWLGLSFLCCRVFFLLFAFKSLVCFGG